MDKAIRTITTSVLQRKLTGFYKWLYFVKRMQNKDREDQDNLFSQYQKIINQSIMAT